LNWWGAVTYHLYSWTHWLSEVLQVSYVLWNTTSNVYNAELLTQFSLQFPNIGLYCFVTTLFVMNFFILMKLKRIQRAQLCACNVGLKNVVLIETTWCRNIWKLALFCLLSALFFTIFCVVIHLCGNVVSAHTGRTGSRSFVIHNLFHDVSKWSIYTDWHITFKYRQSFVNHFNRNKASVIKEWL
jgi:hypothetical protein